MESKNKISYPEIKNSTRRKALKAAILGAGVMATSSVLGSVVQFAQDSITEIPEKELSGKTAFTTGGARGIGLAIAVEMAKVGANIVIFDIASEKIPNVGYPVANENDLQFAKAKIESYGVKCISIKGDVRNNEDIDKSMTQTVTKFGSLDIVIANAGVTQAGDIEEFSHEEISVIFEINVAGVIKTSQAAAPICKTKIWTDYIHFVSIGSNGQRTFSYLHIF